MKRARLTRDIREHAEALGVKLVVVKRFDAKSQVGIHLLMPSTHELWDALHVAERDLFPAIYIHTFSTWAPGAMKRRSAA